MTTNRARGELTREKSWVLHPALKGEESEGRSPEARLAEAVGLAEAIDLDILRAECVPVSRTRPSTLFGSGKVEALAEELAADEASLVVIDATLTPIQQRNLERAWKCKVIDRTGLILEIFGERARTREGRLQVELASLSYQRSRLVRSWTHLERQRGGRGFLGGPGETQIEADRRQIRDRIARLQRELETVTRTRGLHREARRRVPYPVVALVGYTNAGKSTLFNTLTGASVMEADQLFATLDPTMRAIRLESGRTVILSDTVGFISDLPTMLVAAFRATLEEVTEADVILHVRDVSHPDCEVQKEDVLAVLRELGVEERTPMVEVMNKIDRLDPEDRQRQTAQSDRQPETVAVSALTGEGVLTVLDAIDEVLDRDRRIVAVDLPLSDGEGIAWLYRHGEVMSRSDDEVSAHLSVGFDPVNLRRFEAKFPKSAERSKASPAAAE